MDFPFNRLKIRWQLVISNSAVLLLSVALILVVIFLTMTHNLEQEIELYRETEIQGVKDELKNMVDIAHASLLANYTGATDKAYLQKRYGAELKKIVDIAENIVSRARQEAAAGSLSLEEAKRRALDQIEQLRFDDNKGYVWVNSNDAPIPRMIMHPTAPALNGKVLSDPKYDCALGTKKNLFTAFVDEVADDGEGYVDYLWPKPSPDGLTREQPKLSYVRLVPEWGWILGTGIYVDDALADAVEKCKEDIARMRYGSDGNGYFWINDTSSPFPKMVMHPIVPALNGKVMSDPKFNCALGKKENLFKAFVEVVADDGEGYVDYLWPKPTAEGVTSAQPKLSYVRLFEPLNWIIGTGVYIDDIDAKLAQREEQIHQTIQRLFFIILGVMTGVALLVVIGFFLLSNRFAKPIDRCARFAGTLGDGDFSTGIDVRSGDEVGELARSLDAMRSKIRETLMDVSHNSSLVTFSSEQVLTAATTLTETAEKMTQQAGVVAGATEEIATNIKVVSTTTEHIARDAETIDSSSNEVANNIQSVAVAAEELTSSFQEVAANCQQGQELANKAIANNETSRAKMDELNESAASITNVIGMITDITEQTKLLALNATIEAARAGEAGKGFAVVANEVKDLAKQTAIATDEIVQQIQQIQRNTGAVSDSIMETFQINREVDEINTTIAAAVEEQTATVAEIARTVTMTSDHARDVVSKIASFTRSIQEDVVSSVKEASQGVAEIADNIHMLNEGVSRTWSDTAETKIYAEKLIGVAKGLQENMQTFTIGSGKFDLGTVKGAHIAWRARLEGVLYGRQLSADQVASHTQCQFGKWLYGTEADEIRALPLGREVEEAHARVHTLAKAIVTAQCEEKNRDKALGLLADFEETSDNLFKALDELHHSVSKN